MFPGGKLKRNFEMYRVPIIYPSGQELRNISLSPDGDKLLATFCSDYCNRVEVYNRKCFREVS